MSIGDIFPESRGESKNQWEYDGDGLPTVREEKTIIHSENVHTLCHRCYSRRRALSSIPSWESRGYKAMTMAYVVIPERFSFT